MSIRLCNDQDIADIHQIINDAAQAYKGVIPDDRYHEPYMSMEELNYEMKDGVVFWGIEENDELLGIMGIQDKGEVSLIRHAYVRTRQRNGGIGTKLLSHLMSLTDKPVLIGTWASADWAIRFYEKNGFKLVSPSEKKELLNTYWNVPERQIETSVVLSDGKLVRGINGASVMNGLLNEFGEWNDFILRIRDLNWETPLGAGKWRIHDVVSHIALWDKYFLEEAIERIVHRQELTLKHLDYDSFNQNAMEQGKNINKDELIAMAAGYRKTILNRISMMDQDQISKEYADADGNPFTIATYLKDFIWHDRHHMSQIRGVVNIEYIHSENDRT